MEFQKQLIVLVGIIGLLILSCDRNKNLTEQKFVYVKTVSVQEEVLNRIIKVSGTLQANEEAHISSKIPGRIENILVKMGDLVSKDQLLIQLEKKELEVQRNIANADLELIQAKVQEDQFQRQKKLFEKNVISESEFKKIESEYKQATAAREKAKSLVDLSQQQLENTMLETPIDGVVAQIRGNKGEIINAGQPLAYIVSMDPIILVSEVAAENVKFIKPQQKVSLEVRAYPGKKFEGFIKNISPVVDPLSRSLKVEILIPNKNQELKSGMFAEAEIYMEGAASKIVLPKAALLYKEGKPYIFIVENGKAKMRMLKTGEEEKEKIEALAGLSSGQVVVVSGQHKLVEGTNVKISE